MPKRKKSKSLYIVGNSDYITLQDKKDWDLFNNGKDCTIDFWVKFPNRRMKMKWWFLDNIYRPIRRLFGIKELDCTYHVKATKEEEFERMLDNSTEEEIRKMYDIIWTRVHDPEDFIGGND